MEDTMKQASLRWLYGELRKAKIALGRAEEKPGVKREELEALERKTAVIDWIIPIVIREEDNETD